MAQPNLGSSTAAAEPRHIPGLDGLRGVFILGVFLQHGLLSYLVEHPHKSFLAEMYLAISGGLGACGFLGVSGFFVLSGFLITTLLLREKKVRKVNLKTFYFRRLVRIFPAYYLFLAVVALLTVCKFYEVPTSDFLACVLYVANIFQPASWWLSHSWTLCYEEQFYLVWPFLLALLPNRRLITLIFTYITLAPIARTVLYFIESAHRDVIGRQIPGAVEELLVGCLAALLLVEYKAQCERFLKALQPTVLTVVLLIILAVGVPLGITFFHGAFTLTVGYAITAFSFALLIVAASRLHVSALLNTVLNKGLLPKIGVLSYSLYLWQQLFLTTYNPGFTGLPIINIACTIICASLSYYCVERPILKFAHTRRKSETSVTL